MSNQPVFNPTLNPGRRLKRYEDYDGPTFIGIPRFDSKIKVNELTGCWEWQASIWDGYGNYADRVNGKHRKRTTHRVTYEYLVGPIPPGTEIDHLCKNRACCNPAHLEAVSQIENNRRSTSPTALNARKTHCVRGHEFNPENTHIMPNGGRRCRVCKRMLQKLRRSAVPQQTVEKHDQSNDTGVM